MKFIWDPKKSQENKQKHGVSFEEAMRIWEKERLEVKNLAYVKEGESRNATLGFIDDKVFLAIWCYRKESIRLISVRRARKNEEKVFYKKISQYR